jgi:N-methylhydantoinase B
MTWQGGGGYGDPLTRDPEAVAQDLREQKITTDAATAVYGVVVRDEVVDTAATAAERDRLRAARRERSRVLGQARGTADVSGGRRIDDNLVELPADAGMACGHCGQVLGTAEQVTAALYEGPPTDAGPQILATAADYVDAPVVFRQYCCPSCWTALYSAVVPADAVSTLAGAAVG